MPIAFISTLFCYLQRNVIPIIKMFTFFSYIFTSFIHIFIQFFSLFLHTKLQKETESSKLQIKLTRLSRRLQQLRQTISGHLLFLRLVRSRTALICTVS